MQVYNSMDCTSRTDLRDELSHGGHSDEDMPDCDSNDMDRMSRSGLLNTSGGVTNGGHINFAGDNRTPDHQNELHMSNDHHFPSTHPLHALGNFMGLSNLAGLPNMPHNEVLEKLKMQVRDIKAGLMDQDYAAAHVAFNANVLSSPLNSSFSLAPSSMPPFVNGMANGNSNANIGQCATSPSNMPATIPNGSITNTSNSSGSNNFRFTSPTPPNTKDVNPASNSSTSSDASSNASQQNNGWSFEEQYKQVRQLYEINDDPKRKEFLDDLFSFMQKRGTPINRLPIMAKSVLDLFELYNLVIARGGLVDVINKKLWQEIIKGLHLPSSITSAAFTLRTQYMKYLYPYECDKCNLSTPAELQAAIDGNRREGRRSSYGQYETLHNPLQLPLRTPLPGGLQPLALVTHSQQAQAVAAAAAAHQRLMGPAFGQVPSLMTQEIEQRMMEYLKIIQGNKKEHQMNAVGVGGNAPAIMGGGNAISGGGVGGGGGGGGGGIPIDGNNGSNNRNANNNNNSTILSPSAAAHQQQQQQQQQQHRSNSPSNELTHQRDALNAFEMSRVALWQMYRNNNNNNTNSASESPQTVGGNALAGNNGNNNGNASSNTGNGIETQSSEALNLSEAPSNFSAIKREHEQDSMSPQHPVDYDQEPPNKRFHPSMLPGMANLPPGFYMPPNMAAAAAAAANFQHSAANFKTRQDTHNDDDDSHDENNPTISTSPHSQHERRSQLNGSQHHQQQQQQQTNDNHGQRSHMNGTNRRPQDKSDDSAIENSPSTSAASASSGGSGNAPISNNHISPVSSKQLRSQGSDGPDEHGDGNDDNHPTTSLHGLNPFSAMRFEVLRNATGPLGERQLYVNLELNNVSFTGLLTAAPLSSTAADRATDFVHDNHDDYAMESVATPETGEDNEENGSVASTPPNGLRNGSTSTPKQDSASK